MATTVMDGATATATAMDGATGTQQQRKAWRQGEGDDGNGRRDGNGDGRRGSDAMAMMAMDGATAMAMDGAMETRVPAAPASCLEQRSHGKEEDNARVAASRRLLQTLHCQTTKSIASVTVLLLAMVQAIMPISPSVDHFVCGGDLAPYKQRDVWIPSMVEIGRIRKKDQKKVGLYHEHRGVGYYLFMGP
jgi:hypothetical protein